MFLNGINWWIFVIEVQFCLIELQTELQASYSKHFFFFFAVAL